MRNPISFGGRLTIVVGIVAAVLLGGEATATAAAHSDAETPRRPSPPRWRTAMALAQPS